MVMRHAASQYRYETQPTLALLAPAWFGAPLESPSLLIALINHNGFENGKSCDWH